MKKVFVVLALVFIFAFPVQVHAGGMFAGALESTQLMKYIADGIAWYQQSASWIQQAMDMYTQITYMAQEYKRWTANVEAIMDVKSFQDFMKWFNRTLYIEQEAERIYSGMGVKIGGKNYSLTEIDKIPDAVRNQYADRHWGDITDEERYNVYKSLGLAPSNYFYMKTWQNRNEEIKKRFISAREMHGDEFDEAVNRNNEVLKLYSKTDRDELEVDSNKIAMNAHSTQMQIEMVLRDLSLSLDDLKDYIVTRDQENKYIPNPSMPSENWNNDYFKPIVSNKAENNFYN